MKIEKTILKCNVSNKIIAENSILSNIHLDL